MVRHNRLLTVRFVPRPLICSCVIWGRRRQLASQGTHEGTLVTDDATITLIQLISCDALWIGGHLDPVILVGRQARETEQSQRDIVSPLARQKISMMRTAHTNDDRNPEPCIFLELGQFVGVDNVFDVTGNQSRVSFNNVFALGMLTLPAFPSLSCREQAGNQEVALGLVAIVN